MERRPEQPQPCQRRVVTSWPDAHRAVEQILQGQPATLGAGDSYRLPYALFTKDAWSGEGVGYYVYQTDHGQRGRLVADIAIHAPRAGVTPPLAPHADERDG